MPSEDLRALDLLRSEKEELSLDVESLKSHSSSCGPFSSCWKLR